MDVLEGGILDGISSYGLLMFNVEHKSFCATCVSMPPTLPQHVQKKSPTQPRVDLNSTDPPISAGK